MDPAEIAAAAANAPVAPEPAAPAAPAEPAAPAAPVAPAPVVHPWDADVASTFTDPAQAKAVSDFMASKYSPYVQGLEQERAELRGQALLFQQIEENPTDTLVEVISELYPTASAAEVQTFIESLAVAPADPAAPSAPADPLANLTPEQKTAIEWAQAKQAEDVQAAAMTQYLADAQPHIAANPDIPEALFHRYVATTGGDFTNAVARYRAENPAAAPPATPPAPPVLGGAPAGGNDGPKDYGMDLDAAIGDMWAAMGGR